MQHRLNQCFREQTRIEQEKETLNMKLPVTIYQDEEGWYVVECPVIPGCMSQGSTEEEALQNIQEAIQLCLEVRQERGLPLTIQSLEVEVPAYA
jgi:predicted RNase H-like HicB family nuclease